MKVLHAPSKDWKREFECDKCEALLEVGIKDFKRRVCDQRDGDAAVFECANCGAEQWVATDLIPRGLHYLLKS